MRGVLSGDVQPFVESDAGDGFGHGGVAGGVTHSQHMLSQDFGDARAIDMNEGLDLSVVAQNPSQRAVDGVLAGLREEAAIAVEIDGDRGVKLHAGDHCVSANDIDAAGKGVRFQGKAVKALVQRRGDGGPLVVGHAAVSKYNEASRGVTTTAAWTDVPAGEPLHGEQRERQ